ncbi:helicase-related protein [Halococcus sp. PRR34]|uniref:helicase-related protein n=1 Tax=Halococcus sp. PRR34 TaxID=3020830 RepID=UPI002362EF80|nr:helicase-related protein [Halococcus sp. PRR34]
MTDETPPDVSAILEPLKGFQERTARYVFNRLYTDEEYTRRFLVADEVGLGKTLVARAVIAQAIDHLWDNRDRIDVVYLCSNGSIARQNLERLVLDEDQEHAFTSRITLLPKTARSFDENTVNYISFTPGTSLDLKSSMGKKEERVMLYHILKEPWGLTGKPPLNVLQGGATADGFRPMVDNFDATIDEGLSESFIAALDERPELEREFKELCEHYSQHNSRVSDVVNARRQEVLGEIRSVLASVCVEALSPDLIILDEFQRFRDVLDGDTDEGDLAQELFSYSDAHAESRVLLLSATPYKMYTMAHEGDEDHLADFVRTLRFLTGDETAQEIRDLLDAYRRALYQAHESRTDELRELKNGIEAELSQVMVRTERLAASPDRNGMLEEVNYPNMDLQSDEVQAYLELRDVAEHLEAPGVMNYWKSAPYLLNFMNNYSLKEKFRDELGSESGAHLAATLSDSEQLNLSGNQIERYEPVKFQNPTLRALVDEYLETGIWKLLWLPPSSPYYQADGPYAESGVQGATKRLVFSSWRVVPKSVAALVSYEVERRIMDDFDSDALYSEGRSNRGYLLEISRSEGRLTGMPLFTLLYPCPTLAELGDPAEVTARVETDDLPSQEQIRAEISDEIESRLEPIIDQRAGDETDVPGIGTHDEAWYWAAPLLLDLENPNISVADWLGRTNLSSIWQGEESETASSSEFANWQAHINRFRQVADDEITLGPPPDDLIELLTDIAMGAPATATLRALERSVDSASAIDMETALTGAAQVGWAFRTVFNLPEITSLIRGRYPSEPYWRRILEYCRDGNLQAVLDEWVHMLDDFGLADAPSTTVIETISGQMRQSLSLRTASAKMDDIVVDGDNIELEERRIRCHFGLQFGRVEDFDTDEAIRTDQVRNAFNSPFWPFVLTTTSVGQEGLDFHPYCHAVLHWNLPPNPVDLEQREGRVHRYKSHAVRKNVADAYGSQARAEAADSDIWTTMFQAATDAADTTSDLVPYWVFTGDGSDAARIERHAPFLPVSREEHQFAELKESLAVYRMAFGQPRQDDLIEYLLQHLSAEEIKTILEDLQIDLSPY